MDTNLIYCKDLLTGDYVDVPRESLIPRPAAYGIITSDKKILLVPGRHGYTLPGGGVESGETNEEALVREVREETGLSITVSKFIQSSEDYYISAYNRNAYHAIIYIYCCDDIKGDVSTNNFNQYEKQFYRKAEWIDLSDEKILQSAYPKDLLGLINKL